VNYEHTNEMKKWSSQWWLRFKQTQSKPEKCFRCSLKKTRFRKNNLTSASNDILHQICIPCWYRSSVKTEARRLPITARLQLFIDWIELSSV